MENDPNFKRLERDMEEYPKILKELSDKAEEDPKSVTQEDVDKYESIYNDYQKARKEYLDKYDEYRVKAGRTKELGEYSEGGMKGSGGTRSKEKEIEYRE